eukprot:gene15916-17516_t
MTSENGEANTEKEALRKLFCGGLDRNTTDETFRQHFERFGNIVDLVIIRDKNTQESKGFGFVTYDSSGGVGEALAARPHEIDGRTVEIKRAIPREDNTETAHQRTKKLFIGGLPSHVTENDITSYLNETYEGQGNVVKCELIRNKETNEVRGFGFLEVSSEDLSDLIIIKDPKPVICGKRVEIKKCEDRNQPGGRSGRMRGGRGGGRGGGGPRSGGGGGYNVDRSAGADSGYWGGINNTGNTYNAYQGGGGGGMYGAGGGGGYDYGFQNAYGAYGGYGYDQNAYGPPVNYSTPSQSRGGARGGRYKPY